MKNTGYGNVEAVLGARDAARDNAFGIVGCDHVAWPTLDLPAIERFLVDVLGGVVYARVGFDAVDQEMGRSKHVFVRVGGTLVQCAEPEDGMMSVRRDDPNSFPHVAFRMSAAAMVAFARRFQAEGVPHAGPYRHRNLDIVSMYLASPEGHKVELCTWDEFPHPTAVKRAPGAPGVDWVALINGWR